MIKRCFTITLLVWLFSQQLLAAVWATPNDGMGCSEDGIANCMVNSIQPMGHQMPMAALINPPLADAQSSSNSAPPHDQSSMNCDLSITACQVSLFVNDYQFFINPIDFLTMLSSIQTPINTFLDTAYRPPIIA